MKKLISTILFAVTFMACNESKKQTQITENPINTTQSSFGEKPAKTSTDKEKLIAALNRFKLAAETKNKTELAGFFNFPVADSTLTIYDVNDEFDKQRIENGNAMTEKMFSNNFDSLYDYWDFEEFSNLFKYIEISSLNQKDKLEYVHRPKNEGCYFMYHIDVKGNEVTMSYGTNTNDEYLKNHPDDGEVCDEYLSAWVFDWDGKKLTFKKQIIAG